MKRYFIASDNSGYVVIDNIKETLTFNYSGIISPYAKKDFFTEDWDSYIRELLMDGWKEVAAQELILTNAYYA